MNPVRRAIKKRQIAEQQVAAVAREEKEVREERQERDERHAHRGPSPVKVLPISMRTAAEFLEGLGDEHRADRALRDLLETSPLDEFKRREVSRLVMIYFRWRGWIDSNQRFGRQLVAALDLHNQFSRNPRGFGDLDRAVPEWAHAAATLPPETLAQFQREPLLWIRTRRDAALKLGECEPAPVGVGPKGARLSAWIYRGRDDLYRSDAFRAGELEIQDLASQLVSHVCAPKSGEIWWDACAGEGGKALHLAGMMEGKGLVWATDRSLRRIARCKQRAARAGVFNIRLQPWEGTGLPARGFKADGVLVDAPCSGVGTWQRNPHARWTTTPEDVRELAAAQRKLLAAVAPAVKSGGRLIYAVCTLTRVETTDVCDAFEAAHPDFVPMPLGFADQTARHTLWPHELNANGMFIAGWRRK